MNFKTKPYAHQLTVFERSKDSEYFALFMEQGTGKTKPTIDTIQHLYDAGKINRVLVLAPAGVYRNWTNAEIPVHMHESEFVGYAVRSASMTRDEKNHLENVIKNFDLSIVSTNIETLSSGTGFDFCIDFVKNGNTMVVIDEATCIKNTTAKRTDNAIRLGRYAKYRRILTGTPVTQGPLDLFGMSEFLKPGVYGFRNFFHFKQYFAEVTNISYGQRSFKKITGYRNLNELEKLTSKFAYIVTKKDCLDLPEKVYMKYHVPMTKEQEDVYNTLKDTHVAELEDSSISITSALKLLAKFHQIVCGHLKYDDGRVVRLENNRIDALISCLQESAGKVIIFANYVEDIKMISEALTKEFGEASWITYAGADDQETRTDNLIAFRMKNGCRFFVSSQRVGGYGLTLVEATTTIYYSNSYSLEHRLQSEDRNHRIGQTNKVTYIDLVTPGLDERILASLLQKKNIADSLIGNIKALLF